MARSLADARPGGVSPPNGLGGHQALAIGVIHQAFEDLMEGDGNWQDAGGFFAPGSPDLQFWAAVAGVDPVLAARRAWSLWRTRAPSRRCA
jgi:hypothetical protein